jgi:hypothetical protein
MYGHMPRYAVPHCRRPVPALGAAGVGVDLGTQIAADFQASVCAGNIEKAFAIDRADLDVFDRLRLDWKIGSM